MRLPPTCCFSLSQLAALGHEGSPGRTRRKDGLDSARERYEKRGNVASCLSRVRRSMGRNHIVPRVKSGKGRRLKGPTPSQR